MKKILITIAIIALSILALIPIFYPEIGSEIIEIDVLSCVIGLIFILIGMDAANKGYIKTKRSKIYRQAHPKLFRFLLIFDYLIGIGLIFYGLVLGL